MEIEDRQTGSPIHATDDTFYEYFSHFLERKLLFLNQLPPQLHQCLDVIQYLRDPNPYVKILAN
jgi:hypothetical protein